MVRSAGRCVFTGVVAAVIGQQTANIKVRNCGSYSVIHLVVIALSVIVALTENNNNNNNNLHLYSANLYMNIFGCALQYCYIKFMLKVTKA